MSKTINVQHTDTPISGVSSLNFSRGLINFGADFRVKSHSDNEEVITNLTTPLDYPETVRWSVTNVDPYKGTNISPNLRLPSKQGISLLAQVNEVWKVTDTADATLEYALPVSAHLVVKAPNHSSITADMILTLIGRLVSSLYDTGSTESTRLSALLRGSLTPSDM